MALNTAEKTNVPFHRLSNLHISASLRRFSAPDTPQAQSGFASLGDLALYAMIGTILSNPAFTYANGGLHNLLLRHAKNRYFSLHNAIRRLSRAGYLMRTRIPEGKNCFRDYYTLHHTASASVTDKESCCCLTASEGSAFLASHKPYQPPTEDYTEVSIPMLMDPRLSLGAKGLYIVIARYLRLQTYKPELVLSKDQLRSVCHEGFNAFDRLFRELRSTGYLQLSRTRSPKTGYPMFLYTLHKTAVQTSESAAPGTAAGQHIPASNSKTTESVLPAVKNPAAVSNIKTADSPNATGHSRPKSEKTQATAARTLQRAEICSRIEYACLSQEYPRERLDCIVSILLSYLMPSVGKATDTVSFGDTVYPREEIVSRFSALDSEDIRFVLDNYQDAAKTQKIRNIRRYLTVCLFHAKENLALALDAILLKTPGISVT